MEGGWGVCEKVDGIKKYKLVVTNSYGDVKYTIRNINNIVLTVRFQMGTRFVRVITL
mgnify:CR=1 FL=1